MRHFMTFYFFLLFPFFNLGLSRSSGWPRFFFLFGCFQRTSRVQRPDGPSEHQNSAGMQISTSKALFSSGFHGVGGYWSEGQRRGFSFFWAGVQDTTGDKSKTFDFFPFSFLSLSLLLFCVGWGAFHGARHLFPVSLSFQGLFLSAWAGKPGIVKRASVGVFFFLVKR